MLESVLKGIYIGILVSAPMGPIGVLCVQRTLKEGRMHGFLSGVGASMSDLIYAIIAGLGMGFIMDFIEANHNPLQIAGGILLIVFGYFIFNSNPTKQLLKQQDKKSPYWRNILSSFFLNLSNIGILFFFIAMFARYNVIAPNNSSNNIICILSVAIGAILWWLIISSIVNHVRAKFNPRSLKIFNSILGVIIITIGVIGILLGIYHWINSI